MSEAAREGEAELVELQRDGVLELAEGVGDEAVAAAIARRAESASCGNRACVLAPDTVC